jgi:hypothetical protein
VSSTSVARQRARAIREGADFDLSFGSPPAWQSANAGGINRLRTRAYSPCPPAGSASPRQCAEAFPTSFRAHATAGMMWFWAGVSFCRGAAARALSPKPHHLGLGRSYHSFIQIGEQLSWVV